MNDAKYNQARQIKLLTGLWSGGRLRDASWLLLQLPAFGKHRSQSFSKPRQRGMRIVHLVHDSNTGVSCLC